MSKEASPDYPIHELLAKRWSPYGFQNRPVAEADLRSLFEAARWSASSFNEQPWRYIVATQANALDFEKMLLVWRSQTKSGPKLPLSLP